MSMRNRSTLVVVLVLCAASLSAQGPKAGKKALVWGPAPAVFPKGAKMAVESGDPGKSGEFVARLSMPNGYKIPPHFHPSDEHIRIISGAFLVGMGDKLDATKTKKMTPGDTGTVAAKMHHYAVTRGKVVLTVRANGPFAMTYVNPADTPK